jgi:methylmalonyl-CoA mutase N-terminal domain/subunit
VEAGEAIVVGVNDFVSEEAAVPMQPIDEGLERRQVERVRALRRDSAGWRRYAR